MNNCYNLNPSQGFRRKLLRATITVTGPGELDSDSEWLRAAWVAVATGWLLVTVTLRTELQDSLQSHSDVYGYRDGSQPASTSDVTLSLRLAVRHGLRLGGLLSATDSKHPALSVEARWLAMRGQARALRGRASRYQSWAEMSERERLGA